MGTTHRLRSHSVRMSSTIEPESDSDSDSNSDSAVIIVEPTLLSTTRTPSHRSQKKRSTTQSGAGTGFLQPLPPPPSSSSPAKFAQPTLPAFSLSASKRRHQTPSSISSSSMSSVGKLASLAFQVGSSSHSREARKRAAPPTSLPIGVPRPPTKKRARTPVHRSQRQTTPSELLVQLEPSIANDSTTTTKTMMANKWPLAEGFRRRSQKPKAEEEARPGERRLAPSSDNDQSATPTQAEEATPRPIAPNVDVLLHGSSSSPTRPPNGGTAPTRSTTPDMEPPLPLRDPRSVGLAVPSSGFKSVGARTAPRKRTHSPPPPAALPSLPARPESPLQLVAKTARAVTRKKKRRWEDHTSLAPSQRRIRVDPPPWARSRQLSSAAPSTPPTQKPKRSKRGHSRSPSLMSSPPLPQPTMTAAALVSELRTTDFASLDPQHRYGFTNSLLFQIEHVRLGPLSYQQGGRGKIANATTSGCRRAGTASGPEKAAVPSWARTADGKEWEEDVLRRLGVQLALTSPLATSSDTSFVARILGADLARMKQVRLGRAGGLECYLVGRETPCRQVEMMGWIVDREYRERENEHVYAVDDGTGIVSVHCAAPPSAAAGTAGGPRQPFLPPLDPSSSSFTLTTAATIQQRQREAQRLAISCQFAPLGEAAERWSDRTVLPAGKLVRVVGRVEEARSLRERGRRIVAILVELIDDVNAISKHLVAVAELHKGAYAERVDVRRRLEVLEAAEEERRRRDREERSVTVSCASTPSSPEASKAPRVLQPTAPAQLLDLQVHLDGFMRYIKLHCSRRLVRTIRDPDLTPSRSSPSPSSSPSPASSSSNDGEAHTTQVSIPFTLRELRDNYNLTIFATRLAQRKARLELDKRLERAKRVRTLGAFERTVAPRVGSASAERGRAWIGGNPYLGAPNPLLGSGPLPVPSASRNKPRRETSLERRERRRRESLDYFREMGPLYGDELDERIRKTWVSAIRKMREEGMIIEWDDAGEAAASDEPLSGGSRTAGRARTVSPRAALQARQPSRQSLRTEDLPDLPVHSTRSRATSSTTTKPIKRERPAAAVSACPWGDIRFDFSSDDEDGDDKDAKPEVLVTPKAALSSASRAGPVGACPWGDVKLEGDDDDDELPSSPIKKTPRAYETPRPPASPRKRSSPDEYELPPSAQMPSSCTPKRIQRSPSTRSGFSDISFVTTGSLDDDVEVEPRFQLVIASTLCAPILRIVKDLYARNVSAASVSEEGVRKVMAADSRWEAVARWSVEVEKALDMLCEEGSLQRHGQGYRPTSRW